MTHGLSTGRTIGWWPLLFTTFGGFLFLEPWQRGASVQTWTITVAGVLLFVGLYALALRYAHRRAVTLAAVAGVSLLGFAFAPFNSGAAIFIIFATSFVPYALRGEIKPSVAVIGLILGGVALESWLLDLSWVFPVYSGLYTLVLGTGNIYGARMAFDTERLAKADERERIARDLHDVVGHSLSLITLKAELAGRVLDTDPERARAELRDLERVSRETLAEVRQTIDGYFSGGLQAELERARTLLATGGVKAHTQVAVPAMTPAQERVIALVLREAVTNVVRHAGASNCHLRVEDGGTSCRLEVADDGRGQWQGEGHGVRGMRERVEALGGTLVTRVDRGTTLTVTLPLRSATSASPQ